MFPGGAEDSERLQTNRCDGSISIEPSGLGMMDSMTHRLRRAIQTRIIVETAIPMA